MRLFYFNPYNDLALAAPDAHFTPPASALAIARAGCALPLWWADPADAVLVPDAACLAEARRIAALHNLPDVAVTASPSLDITELQPWGWSGHMANIFARAGVDASLLPSPEALAGMRLLSHRRTAIEVLKHIGWHSELMPVEASTVDEAVDLLRRRGKAVMKLPWSGSGRGVIMAHEIPLATLHGYIEGVIRRQGSIIVEPWYERVLDFAMLFDITDTAVSFTGLSVFASDTRGRYAGNIVASQQHLAGLIGSDVSYLIPPVAQALRDITAGLYRGPVGVDMMVYRTASSGHTAIMPCIEVNMRNTMGMVAERLARKGLRGVLRYCPEPGMGGTILSGSGPCFKIE